VVREEVIRRGGGGAVRRGGRGKPLGVVRKEAIRRGEKSCFTGGEED
jgi:hypothetical protein